MLSRAQVAALNSGLQALEEEHCIVYVAITRAKSFCGLLQDSLEREEDNLPLDR